MPILYSNCCAIKYIINIINVLNWLILKLLSENRFQWSWPCDPKIKRGLLLNIDNHPMKFEHCGPNGT
jgi:hypothetical protein